MSDPPFTLVQKIFKKAHPPILVIPCPLAGLTRSVLQDFLDTAEEDIIGVAPAYGTNSVLSVVALASGSKPKFAFQMDVLRLLSISILGSTFVLPSILISVAKKDDRRSVEAIMSSIGGAVGLKSQRNLSKTTLKEVALQAWVAWRAATLDNMTARLNNVPRIDTSSFAQPRLFAFAKLVRDARRLAALKPTSVRNEIATDYSTANDRLHVTCTRFQNHIRPGDQRTVIVEVIDGGQRTTIPGRTTRVNGRAVEMNLNKSLPSGSIKLTTVGREPLSQAEEQRIDIVLRALQKTSTSQINLSFRRFGYQKKPLHGRHLRPPGTGKTTVIAAAVTSISASSTRTYFHYDW
ncbi:hypothetical protein B0H13DRAFT_2248269 [Mycena leptocephala]|nr:hypothetical protein B0H13DRAFT_2248269 [Mycena leptocephala]